MKSNFLKIINFLKKRFIEYFKKIFNKKTPTCLEDLTKNQILERIYELFKRIDLIPFERFDTADSLKQYVLEPFYFLDYTKAIVIDGENLKHG